MEIMDLLEECWFFDNMLNIRSTMPRCYSDPCPSTGLSRYSSTSKKAPNNGGFVHTKKIHRAPSMPPLRVREEGDKNGSKLVHQKSDLVVAGQPSTPHCAHMKWYYRSDCNRRKSKLLRTPSLPPSIGRSEKFQVTDPRTSRSPKKASTPPHIEVLPPRQISKSCSIPRPTTNGEVESRLRFRNQRTMRRSISDLELEEVKGFKDLGFSFEKEGLSPSVTNIIPGLQDKNRDETEEDKAARGPYLSEAWLVQTCTPPFRPNWDSNKSETCMKEQIKFWARVVASNVQH